MTNLRKIISISFFSIQMVNHSLNAQQQEKGNEDIDRDTVYRLEEVVVSGRQILGSKFKARNRTGSAYYISPEEIRKFGYTDINRMLKAVPGVNMYEEDGFGLRPNISLRGTKAERSERISIMEDGILAAPAPYSAPAAYYFPNAARMEAVEVVKGSSQVHYGRSHQHGIDSYTEHFFWHGEPLLRKQEHVQVAYAHRKHVEAFRFYGGISALSVGRIQEIRRPSRQRIQQRRPHS